MKKSNTTISIGMPTYNGQLHIKQAIVSLLQQKYSDFELIISDDASTDKTETICLEYAKKDKRILYIRQEKNLGFIKNFNFVLKKAKGEYFMWAGNDDYWDRDYLTKLHSLFQKFPDTVLAVSKFNNVFNKRPYNYLKKQYIGNGLNKLVYLRHFLQTRNLSYFYGLHLTENLKKIGGYHSDSRPFYQSSDFLTIFRVLLNGNLSYIDEVLFYKRDTGHFTNQFKLARSHAFDTDIQKKLLRFLIYPVYYCYDLFYATGYIFRSSLSKFEKISLLYFLIIGFIKYNIGHIFKITNGAFLFLLGFIDKLKKNNG